MKKILYVDLFSQYGHTNLNRVYIDRFNEIGYKVEFVLRKDYINELKIPFEDVRLALPERYFDCRAGKIKDRFLQWKMLRLIINKIDLDQYNIIFFSFFEEMSICMSGIKGNLIFLNHSNVTGLENVLKLFFLKRVAKIGKILVFHESIKNRFSEFGINNVLVEPLGLAKPYDLEMDRQDEVLRSLDHRLISPFYRVKILVPTGSKYNDLLIKNAINDPLFLSFIIANKVLIIIKDITLSSDCENICLLESYLSNIQYQILFRSSDCIIINYPETFRYKVSATLFECFANKKPCFLIDIDSFRLFQEYFNYEPYYNDIPSLISLIKTFIEEIDEISMQPYINIESLNPQFDSVVNLFGK